MKKIMFLCLFGMSFIMSQAQVITVVDQENNTPLELVTIVSNSDNVVLTTNHKGQADITIFEGARAIQIRMVGYATVIMSFDELENQGFQVALEPTSVEIDQYVVSATRWSQSTAEVPQKIISVTPKEVAFMNPQTAADLLSISGQVYVQKSQLGGGSPMIRGFATNRLLYTIDGVRMNTAIFRGGNIQNVISLDPFAIESTEISFGPGSVIYGSDAIGGVMSFQTLTPQFSLEDKPTISGKANMRYASASNEQTIHADLNIGLEKWAFATSFSGNDFGDLRMGSNGPDDYLKPFVVVRGNGEDLVLPNEDPRIQNPSGYTQYNIMQKVRFQPNEAWDFQYGFHYSQTSSYGRYDRHNRMRNGAPRYGEWSYGPQVWMMNNLNVFHNTQNALFDGMTIRVAQQHFEESRRDRNLNSTERSVRNEEVEAYSLNLDFTKSLSGKSRLFYGLEYVLNDVNSTGEDQDIVSGTSQPGPSRYPQANWSSYAAYITQEFKASEQLTLQAGLRYNRFDLDATFDTNFYPFPFSKAEINEGALTGSVGAVFRPTSSWVINANLATGFRSPNVDDVGKVFDSEPGAVVVPNPDLEAETAYNADFGIAKIFSNLLKVEVTAFYTYLDNAMVRRDFQLNGMDEIIYDGELSQVQAIQNAASAEVYGFQLGAELKLPAGFSLSTMYNYQHGEEELDDGTKSPMRHAAPSFGMTRLNYSASKWRLSLYADYHAEVAYEDLPESEKGKTEIYAADSNGNPYTPAWYTLNFKAQYLLNRTVTLTSGVENITDQRYRPYSSGISGAGTNFIIALKVNF
ncbi:TonB-dependent receptor plug domain-containing protein [Roseivirga sp.]|uniref:TonB-dependent receptor plug domain-containing protein n=1 Tax=Roseivirga sp. TaxID=1964215 RepID=UPI003B51C9D8